MLKNKLYLAVYLILVFTFLLSNCKMFGQTITVDNNMAIISFNNSTSTVTTDKQQSILTKIKQRETTKSIKIFKVENDNIAEIANCSSFRFGKNNEVVYSINDNETNMQKGSISFWKGKQTKAIGNTTILVFEGDDITGSVWLNDQLYKIEPLGDGLHAFIEIDPSKILNESPPIEINEEQNNNKQNKVNKIKSTTSAVIDVLVAYTTAAKNASGNISSLIQLAVAEANQSYENGDVSVRINLVYSYEVSYTESGVMATDLINFRGTSDGEMDEVHTYRNQYGADVCVLIVSSGNSCGRSYQTPTSSYAFAVVKYSCATGNYTFAHEIGHIQNCRHDICNDPAGSYNHGYEYCSGNWRTIMAYDTSCCTNHTTRLQYWSNPDITYNGVAMGTVQDEDNARMLDYYSPTVEAFKSTFASGELAANQTWYYKELSGNVTVPLGKTLTIPSSSTINLNGYSITTDGGTIDVSSGATLNGLKAKVYSSELKGICGTLQAAIDIASAQESIVVSEGTINEDISIVGKTNLNIHDVDLNGDISMTNSDYMVLQDNTCNNIYISNCDYPWIWSVVVEGSGSGNGVSMYNVAHLSQYGNSSITVDNFENGLYAISVTFGMENLINSAFTRVDNGVVGYANANITL
ncbi:MAG: M12 family metallo-peptidase, partial [Ignavibacteria bacterium]